MCLFVNCVYNNHIKGVSAGCKWLWTNLCEDTYVAGSSSVISEFAWRMWKNPKHAS